MKREYSQEQLDTAKKEIDKLKQSLKEHELSKYTTAELRQEIKRRKKTK